MLGGENAEPRAHTGLSNSLLGERLDEGRLVALSVDELVVQDLDIGVVGAVHDDLVGDGLGIGKGGNILSDTSKRHLDGIGAGTEELRLALLTDDDKVKGLGGFVGVGADASAQTGMDTTAEALVGGADDDERLLLLDFGDSRLGGLEDLAGSLAVLAGLGHGALGTVELGRGDNLHCAGNLLDVLNRLATVIDFSECRVGGSSVGADSGSPVYTQASKHFLVSKDCPPGNSIGRAISKDSGNRLFCKSSPRKQYHILWLLLGLYRGPQRPLGDSPHRSRDRGSKSRTGRP